MSGRCGNKAPFAKTTKKGTSSEHSRVNSRNASSVKRLATEGNLENKPPQAPVITLPPVYRTGRDQTKVLRVRITSTSLAFGFSRGSQMMVKGIRAIFSDSKEENPSGVDPNVSDTVTQ